MAEGVPEGGPRRDAPGPGAEAEQAPVLHRLVDAQLGEGPEARPDAGRRPALEEHRARGVPDDEKAGRARGQWPCSPGLGVAVDLPGGPRPAVLRHRAALAGGSPGQAEGGAQVHDRLGVVGDPVGRGVGLGEGPEAPLRGAGARPSVHAVVAGEHALDVAVQDRVALAEGQGEDGGRRGPPHAGQGGQRGRIPGQLAPVEVADAGGGPVQVSRPRVVAEPAPEGEDFVEGSGREGCGVGKPGDEPLEIGRGGRDPRLLQHHLRDPDTVGRALLLPRQVLAPLPVVPGEQAGWEGVESVSQLKNPRSRFFAFSPFSPPSLRSMASSTFRRSCSRALALTASSSSSR